MKYKQKMIGLLLLIVATSIWAQSSGGSYEIKSKTTDSGSQVASGGNYSVQATFAQPDASTEDGVGGNYLLSAGFWNISNNDLIFRDGFEG